MFDGFGLYVHVPYCRIHCPYCDFNVVAASRWPERGYTRALVEELRRCARSAPFRGKRLESVFFGGGTPSLFAPASIEGVIREAYSRFLAPPDVEVSLEATPETASVERLSGYRKAGVNRVSLGVQSFRPAILKRLRRAHTATETARAVPAARRAGFANVSMDLMFAIPGQTLDEWRADLDTAISHRPEHVSAYNLTYEEGTPFFDLVRRGRLVPLDDDLEAEMFEEARTRLGAAGYRAYEVSNFALPGFESKHNRNYWRAGPYLGIGAGAHSHAPIGRRARRWWNVRDPQDYVRRIALDGHAVSSRETVEPMSAAGEYVFLHLRTVEGVGEEAFLARFGTSLESTFPDVRRLIDDDLLEKTGRDRIALTRRGLLLADAVFASFLYEGGESLGPVAIARAAR